MKWPDILQADKVLDKKLWKSILSAYGKGGTMQHVFRTRMVYCAQFDVSIYKFRILEIKVEGLDFSSGGHCIAMQHVGFSKLLFDCVFYWVKFEKL